MTRRGVLVLALAALLAAEPALAGVRVDDTGTLVSAPVVPMRWRQLVPGRGADHTVEADVRVAVRLNTSPWVNQSVRLYMVLAPVNGQSVVANWRTQGRLLAGNLRSGSRAVVFEGRISGPVLEETLDLHLATDGRNFAGTQALQFSFEVDTP